MMWFLRFIRAGWWGYRAPVRVNLDVLNTLAVGRPVSNLAGEKRAVARTVVGLGAEVTAREVI